MTKVADAYVEIRADSSKLKPGLNKAVSSTKQASGKMKSSVGGLGKMFAAAGAAAMAAFAFKSVIGAAAKFEEKMVQSMSIVTGLTEEMAVKMKKTALVMTRNTTFSADQAAEAHW